MDTESGIEDPSAAAAKREIGNIFNVGAATTNKEAWMVSKEKKELRSLREKSKVGECLWQNSC